MKKILFIFLITLIILSACSQNDFPFIEDRESKIPDDAVKMTPNDDVFKPVLLSNDYEYPVPLDSMINTAGAEDSPFINGDTLFFFFTPNVDVPADKQLIDSVTGIWFSIKDGNTWTKSQRVILNDDVSLDGAEFILGDTMWFASVRTGNYTEVDIYKAYYKNDEWTDWENAGELLNGEYDIGELHITSNGDTMYFGWDKDGYGGRDLYYIVRDGDSWTEPMNCGSIVNSDKNEDLPFITKDCSELWFTGDSKAGYTGPALYRCKKVNGEWGEPEEIIANFAGEPTLDDDGNIYFVHHFFDSDFNMIEADIYFAKKK